MQEGQKEGGFSMEIFRGKRYERLPRKLDMASPTSMR
jgi:hypothetical protein